jgi:hypothetical protein
MIKVRAIFYARACPKHPRVRGQSSQGFAVGHIEPYRCEGSTENPCICIIHTKGCYGETLMNICYHLSTSAKQFHFDTYPMIRPPESLFDF